MFTSLLRGASQRYYPCSVEDVKWGNTQKEARIIDTLDPVLMQHRLVVCPSVIEADYKSTEGYPGEDVQRCRLMYQMTRITRDKGSLAYDDRLDAVAGAVAYWVDVMARNSEQAAIAHKEALRDAELERFMANSLSRGAEGGGQWASGVMRSSGFTRH